MASAAVAETAGPGRFVRRNYFPTLIFQKDLENSEELNRKLLELTYAERDTGVAVNRSNTAALGSWHSHTELHKNPDYAELMKEIKAVLRRISKELGYARDQVLKVSTMWSIINPPGNGNRAHIHPGSLWSGVYYLQAPEGAGKIQFIDPRTTVIMNPPKFQSKKNPPRECRTKVNITPVAGKMVIFPGWLYHGVDLNTSKETGRAGDRIIISFNVSQVKK